MHGWNGRRSIGSKLRRRRLTIGASLLAAMVLSAPAGPMLGAARDASPAEIVSERRLLDAAEVRAADVTDKGIGIETLANLREDAASIWASGRPARVFKFGADRVVVDLATELIVYAGLDAQGDPAYEVVPVATPVGASPSGGYDYPPNAYWGFNTQGGYTRYFKATTCDAFGYCVTKDRWRMDIKWVIDAAWNYNCYGRTGKCQFFRNFGQMRAQVLTGANFPYSRAWLEFDAQGWGGSPADNHEFHQPENGIAGTADTTKTIGFGAGLNIKLGEAPIVAGGEISGDYKGSITTSSEWWHPVSRSEIASGGVQWCRYAGTWEVTRSIATRVGVMQNVNATLGSWLIYNGMANKTTNCPSIG